MFKLLSREELWELYFTLKNANLNLYCVNLRKRDVRLDRMYTEINELREEIWEVINPWPSYPIL